MTPRARLSSFSLAIFIGVIPIYIGAVGRYGIKVLAALGLSVLTGSVVDWMVFRLRETAPRRWSWPVWIVFPLALPPGAPLWVVPAGIIFSLVFIIHFFGGFGRNLFPTATAGVVFLAISYPMAMGIVIKPFGEPGMGFSRYSSQIPVGSALLADLRSFREVPVSDALMGRIPGNIGDSYSGYLISLAMVMMILGFLDPRFGLYATAGIIFFSWTGHNLFPDRVLDPAFQIVSGSIPLYLAVFLPSDPFALPRTPEGRRAGGLLFAFFAVLLRSFTISNAGVFFAGLLTSVFSPLIDGFVAERFYGRGGTPR